MGFSKFVLVPAQNGPDFLETVTCGIEALQTIPSNFQNTERFSTSSEASPTRVLTFGAHGCTQSIGTLQVPSKGSGPPRQYNFLNNNWSEDHTDALRPVIPKARRASSNHPNAHVSWH